MAQKIKISKDHQLKDLTSIAQTMMPLAKQLLGARGMLEIEILSNWRTIVGEALAQYTLPQKITFNKDQRTGGCLYVLTLSGAFAVEVQQKEEKILQNINAFFGYPAVAKLRILQTGSPENFLCAKKLPDNVKKMLVTEEQETYITELTKDVEQPDLQDVLQRVGRAVLHHQKK